VNRCHLAEYVDQHWPPVHVIMDPSRSVECRESCLAKEVLTFHEGLCCMVCVMGDRRSWISSKG